MLTEKQFYEWRQQRRRKAARVRNIQQKIVELRSAKRAELIDTYQRLLQALEQSYATDRKRLLGKLAELQGEPTGKESRVIDLDG